MLRQKTLIILGGGTGGLVTANKLNKKIGRMARIILLDKNPNHIYAPSFLYLMLGKRLAEKIQKPLSMLKRKGIEFINDDVVKINPESRTVETKNQGLHYDYLIIALGAELAPEKAPELAQSGYNLYELKEVERLRDNLRKFSGGKVAVVISSLPFKCPAAPYEAAFLLDEHFQKRGIRSQTEISIFTPETLPMPAAGPENGKAIKKMLEERDIAFNGEAQPHSVEPFDLIIFIPPHQGAKVVKDSGIGNENGWIPVDGKTLRAKYDNVFAIGDGAVITLASGKPLPKAGVFAHFEAEVVAENIASEILGTPDNKEYNGQAYCFLETGYGKAGLAKGNFYAEPEPAIELKTPSKIWHWGKILFEKYWFRRWF